MSLDFSNDPHRRYNPLTGQWILVSPHRTKRPWQGKQETPPKSERPEYDPNCYLCPGNTRASGVTNPNYESTYAFDNDFAALLPDTEPTTFEDGLLLAKSEAGICRVICFSPRHDQTLADMDQEQLEAVIQLWQDQFLDLAAKPQINNIQIFENKGELMGCSNPHPHGQIWAQSSIPELILAKRHHQQAYFEKTGRLMLMDYLKQEQQSGERILYSNDGFTVLVPFWAVWPFETMILPIEPVPSVGAFSSAQKSQFADAIGALCRAYDRLFDVSFPYSAGLQNPPVDGSNTESWQFHMSFYPPLLRSATVKKFMVGYELFANPQRDISAEQAAERLRGLF
ncbi:MAG: UDP-glucose--hexose-1-phosphate uridylyltransferase [Bacteroidota bacterium]